MQQNPSSTILSELLKLYLPVLTLEEGAKLLRFPTVNAVRIAKSRNHLPVPIRKVGGRSVFFLSDIANFLESGHPQCQVRPTLPQVEEPKRRGRPRKAAQIAHRNAEYSTRLVGGWQ